MNNNNETLHSLKPRLLSIDLLRGLIIIFMALDHTRDFWGHTPFDPTDLQQTTPLWFFTRWITHYCAPLFVFLTGVSAFLYGQKVQSTAQVQKFLITRGFWLIFLELVVVNLSWQFGYTFAFVQVIWAIGCSMVVLALLLYLPMRAIFFTCLPIVLLHNGLNDPWFMGLSEGSDWLWKILHVPGGFLLGESTFWIYVAYPLMPWFAVMGLGYCAGQIYQMDADKRLSLLWLSGIACVVLFIVLRVSNFYGDPSAFDPDNAHWFLSLLNTTKYPPSLLFLLMTLGPGLILLALLERVSLPAGKLSVFKLLHVFGSVPLFFYLLHVPLINLGAHIYTWLVYGTAVNFMQGSGAYPDGYEPSLGLAYVAWLTLLVLLYWPCKYYGELKRRSKNPLLSYL